MPSYYNEIDPFAVRWLRNLIAAGHLPDGEVDDRSIEDVRPDDLKGFTQCHFFAGIGGWPYALRLAGWDDARSVWTGSCPCQSFSIAGKRKGAADDRHLWPVWFRLIQECRPAAIFGEQVSAAITLGWWDAVATDLERAGYAAGACVLGAHSVGAPHLRQRLWWVGDADGRGFGGERVHLREGGSQEAGADVAGAGSTDKLGDAAGGGRQRPHRAEKQKRRALYSNPWARSEWLPCQDGKARPTKPGLFPLADGISNRVGRLRAYGNAIVPQVAAAFVSAFDDGHA